MGADPTTLLQRLAALRGARLPEPPDLVADVLEWIGGAAGPILDGTDADVALGLRPPRGVHRVATVYRQSRLDQGLAKAFALATGTSQEKRGDCVLTWWGEFESGRPVPPAVADALRLVASSGLPVPSNARSVARTADRVSRVVLPPGDCATVDSEGPPSVATSTRT